MASVSKNQSLAAPSPGLIRPRKNSWASLLRLVANESDASQRSGASARTTDAPQRSIYEERVVAFIDILGFKEIVMRSAYDDALARRIYGALDLRHDNFAKYFADEVDLDWAPADFDDLFHTFSDCIVISVRPRAEEIGLLIFVIFRICRQLLSDGFLSRGGIAKGLLYHRASRQLDTAGASCDTDQGPPSVPIVFGPAFIDAYNFESAHAGGPRVILQNKVWQEIDTYCLAYPNKKLAGFFRAHVKRADDGPAYVDLFADFVSNGNFYDAKRNLDDEIRAIKEHICDALDRAADKPNYFKKNAQLARLFNRAVRKSERSEHLIPESKLPSSNLWTDNVPGDDRGRRDH